jgi:hypothetical protein
MRAVIGPMTPNAVLHGSAGPDVERFLRLSLQARRNPSALAQAEALAPALDWQEVGRVAAAERLRPLLHQAWAGSAVVPATLLADWRQNYLESARHNLRSLYELSLVLRRLGEDRVDALVLKGAGLIAMVYGNIALRPLRDLDLLVRPVGLQPALDCLKALGYQRMGIERQPGSLTAFENQAQLVKPGGLGTVVEIHWSLFDSPHYQDRLALDWFWQAQQKVEINGALASVPGQGAHLLYLAGHLWLHHQGEGLLWWNDLAELVAHAPGSVDWEQVINWAEQYDLVLPLQQVMAALVQDWDASLPVGVLDRLLALRPSAVERRVFEALTAGVTPAGKRLWVDLVSTPGWRRRARFAWSNILPSADYMRMRYNIRHGLLTPLYYPYRWLLGIRSALWKAN